MQQHGQQPQRLGGVVEDCRRPRMVGLDRASRRGLL